MNNKTLTPAIILAVIALLCNSIIATQVRYGKYAFRDEFNKASNAPIDSSNNFDRFERQNLDNQTGKHISRTAERKIVFQPANRRIVEWTGCKERRFVGRIESERQNNFDQRVFFPTVQGNDVFASRNQNGNHGGREGI